METARRESGRENRGGDQVSVAEVVVVVGMRIFALFFLAFQDQDPVSPRPALVCAVCLYRLSAIVSHRIDTRRVTRE